MTAYDNDPRVIREQGNLFYVPSPGGHPKNPDPAWGVLYSNLVQAWVAVPPDAVGTPELISELPHFSTADEAIYSLIGDPQ